MKAPLPNPFKHVPADGQVSIFVWMGRRERCEGSLSRTFGLDHEAAKAYFADAFRRDDVSKVQVFAGWFDGAAGTTPVRRIDCRMDGSMLIRDRDASAKPMPSRFPDANLDADLFALLDAA